MDVDDMDLDSFIELESSVWDALRRGDAEEDARLLADDFLGVYPQRVRGSIGPCRPAGERPDGCGLRATRRAADGDLRRTTCCFSYRADWHRLAGGRSRPARVDVHQLLVVPTRWSLGERLQPGFTDRYVSGLAQPRH